MRLEKNSEEENDIKSNTKYVTNMQREKEWLKENKEAIEKQNERIKKEGSFSDEHRRF